MVFGETLGRRLLENAVRSGSGCRNLADNIWILPRCLQSLQYAFKTTDA
jgi:hypothetical protein